MSHDPSHTQPDTRGAALQSFVHSRMRTPFAWGTHDCCTFAADWVLALTGVDHAADVRGTYSDAAGALRTLEQLGGIEAVGARAGEQILPLMARAGDVGIIHAGERAMLGVCAGSVWLVTGTRGLAAHPLDAAQMAWRVYA
jgi:hypothetical protein